MIAAFSINPGDPFRKKRTLSINSWQMVGKIAGIK